MNRRTSAMMILALIALFAWDAHAGGKTIGNGGDEIALEFQNAALRALDVSLGLGLIQQSDIFPLRNAALKAAYLTTENPLGSFRGEIEQESIAVNLPESNTILINRWRWLDVTNPRLQEGVALHEVLSLLGKKSTANYSVSGAYLAQYMLDVRALHPLGKGEELIVNCSDYGNSLFSVLGLRESMQRISITPVGDGARETLKQFAISLGIPFPDNVTAVSLELPEDDCDFDPRNRGVIKCNRERRLRPGSLDLLYKNGVILLHPVQDLRFTVGSPYNGRVPQAKRVDTLELGITKNGQRSELFLNIRARTCH